MSDSPPRHRIKRLFDRLKGGFSSVDTTRKHDVQVDTSLSGSPCLRTTGLSQSEPQDGKDSSNPSAISKTANDLPCELVTQILEYMVFQQDGYPLAPLATVCRLWNQILEPYLFAELTFYLTNASILSGNINPGSLANTIRGSRQLCLKKLRLVIDVDLSSFTTIVDYPRRRMRLGADFADVMEGFIETLISWKRDASIDLEIHEEQSCGHYLNHFESNLARGTLGTVHCVRSIRHLEYNCDRCRCCSYRGLLSYLCSTMKESDQLKEVSFGYQERESWKLNRSIQYERWDFIPPAVSSLTVRNMEEPVNMYRASTVFKTSLLSARHQLRTFHCSFALDACHLKPPRWIVLRWPFLQHLSMTFDGLRGGGHYFNEMMMIMAEVARGMPEIKQLELWVPEERDASHFCYTVENKKARAIWSMSREFKVPDDVEREWDLTARQHTRRGVTTEVRRIDVTGSDTGEALPPAREAAAFFSGRSYTADPLHKQKFEVPYQHRFEYPYDFETWGTDAFYRWEEDEDYPGSEDESD